MIHLPVPFYRGGRALSRRQKLVRSGIGTALFTVVAPEFLAVTALMELLDSWHEKKVIQRLTQMKWTFTHQFFVRMGGICLKSPSGGHLQLGRIEVISALKAKNSDSKNTIDNSHWVSELEKLTEDQILDLAKSDTLTKLIACGQTLWLVTQVVSRLFQHQAVTLLEVSTCAYVLCALLSYAAWWKKPQGCTSPIMILCSDEALSEFKSGQSESYYYETEDIWEFLWAGQHWSEVYPDYEGNFDYLFMGCVLGLWPALFGAIHVASWNISLPSGVELWMWRASSVYCLIAGVAITVVLYFFGDDNLPSWAETTLSILPIAITLVYIIVRIYMIVEVFISLRALPRSAFETVQWSSFIPHI